MAWRRVPAVATALVACAFILCGCGSEPSRSPVEISSEEDVVRKTMPGMERVYRGEMSEQDMMKMFNPKAGAPDYNKK